MSLKRLVAAAFFGVLSGGGAAIALIQSGWLASSANSVLISAGASAVVGVATTALARFRFVRVSLTLASIALCALMFFLAQSPDADARQAVQNDTCATAQIGDVVIQGLPARETLGSVDRPIRVRVDGAKSVSIEIRTPIPFEEVSGQASIIEPVDLRGSIPFSADDLDFENGRGLLELEIVESRLGLSVRVEGETFPLPFGTALIEGSFSNPDSRTAPAPPCRFALHFQLVTSAFDTLAGRIGLGALGVGVIGLLALAFTAGRTVSPVPPPATGGTARPAPPASTARPPAPAGPPATTPPPPATQPSVGVPSTPPPPAAAQLPPPVAQPSVGVPTAPPSPAATPPPPPSATPPRPPPPASTPAPPTAPAATPPPPPAPPPAPAGVPITPPAPTIAPRLLTSERFVQMRIEVDDFMEHGFFGGRPNQLTFWIGPEIVSDMVARATAAVPETGRSVNLDARFEWPGGDAHTQMTLSADPTQRSNPKFVVTVDVSADATRFQGTLFLWVRETGRLYEHVKVMGEVQPRSHNNQPRLLSIVEDRGQVERVGESSADMGACLIHEGNSLLWYTGSEPAIFDGAGFDSVLNSLSSAVANLQARSGVVDWSSESAIALLRTLAVEGAKLRYAVAGTIDPGDALQFYNHHSKSSIPLEWIYDRGHTAPTAVVKPSCITSLRAGLDADRRIDAPYPCGCPPASQLSAETKFSNPILCPWGFWGLAKVIERYDAEPAIINNFAHPNDDKTLPPLTSILLGANESLDRLSGRPGEPVLDLGTALASSVATDRVYTWADWRAHLAAGRSNFAVTLPHQDGDSLQIGTDRLMLSQVPVLLPEHFSGIVMLLGCRTTQPVADGFASFSRLFKDHAAVVIGSSATLVTSDAARLAVGLVEQLVSISQTDQPLGQAIVAARRQLVADGLPIALAVTAMGDADWRFAIERQPLVSA